MYLIQTSKDLLNIVLAFCILWLTIFIAWFIYYLIMMMRQAYRITQEMNARLHKIDELITTFKERIEHGTTYLSLIGEAVKKILEIAKELHEKKKKKK